MAAADVITEPVDEVQRLLDEEGRMLHAIDLDGETYMRSEGGSLLVGVCKNLSERCSARTLVANLKGTSSQTSRTAVRGRRTARPGTTARTSCSSRTSSGSHRS